MMVNNNNSSKKTLSFSLSEIASWQLNSDKSEVELPALQRGFVWKVNQIEALWDSVLRGFPIGSFLLSENKDGRTFILDGQQRATSIALGYYNPWDSNSAKFWSLKKHNIPILWIDLAPSDKTSTQKYVIRVITQSHPWGYQRIYNNSVLSVSDRRNALSIYRANPSNHECGYINLSLLKVFPYDSNLPVPLTFVLKSIKEHINDWKESLINLCQVNLPVDFIKTKHNGNNAKNYIEQLTDALNNNETYNDILKALNNIDNFEIPGIVVKNEILKMEDGQTGDDPTLFVRLNSSGTRIAGEELIYSIYKASFPEAKDLVENIGASFAAPSLVISLASRLILSEINEGSYPRSMGVNDFIKKIKDEEFNDRLKSIIGNNEHSQAKTLFNQAFEILLSKDDFAIPPVIVKGIIKSSPDLFLMLLQWLKMNNGQLNFDDRTRILATITSLSWFGRDNTRFVRELWDSIPTKEFWNKETLQKPFFDKRDYILHPLIKPSTLREYLLQAVVESNVKWENLYPDIESDIYKTFKKILSSEIEQENEIASALSNIWSNFINKIVWNKSLVLFAQREYINQSFGEYNQMETLEDTNTPWDWDHIYPSSWVHGKWYIDPNTKHWTSTIGNFRALSLEENRSESNSLSPKDRLADVKRQSFIKEDDWEYWSKIDSRINEGNNEMIKNHLGAIVTRLCNIYEEWYLALDIGKLFNYQD